MPPHHEAWLRDHPERSEAWLKQMLKEGFHIHHVDGDHHNNHPANLVLIESVDHMRLHGMFGLLRSNIHKEAAKGGKARMQSMTPEQRRKQAKMASNKRWIAHRRRVREREAHKA